MPNPKKLPKWAIKQAGGINKKAWALARRGRGSKSKAKPKKAKKKASRGGGGSRGNPGPTNKKPRIGASYQSTRYGLLALSPAVDPGLRAASLGGELEASYRAAYTRAKTRAMDIAAHEIVVGVDAIVDKKMGQAAAISRGSITAIVPEFFAGVQAFNSARTGANFGDALRQGNRAYNQNITGLDPQSQTHDLSRTRTYRMLKHGGQAIRLARSKVDLFNRLTAPLSKALGSVGASI